MRHSASPYSILFKTAQHTKTTTSEGSISYINSQRHILVSYHTASLQQIQLGDNLGLWTDSHTFTTFLLSVQYHSRGISINDIQEEVCRVIIGLTLVTCKRKQLRYMRKSTYMLKKKIKKLHLGLMLLKAKHWAKPEEALQDCVWEEPRVCAALWGHQGLPECHHPLEEVASPPTNFRTRLSSIMQL